MQLGFGIAFTNDATIGPTVWSGACQCACWLNRLRVKFAMCLNVLACCGMEKDRMTTRLASTRSWVAPASGQWHLYPECNAVLIGTQDMLLSRALNRGYACPRARWPVEFGLLNHDALWVMDEVQLMDTGLATSGQLQVFRDEDRDAEKSLRPSFTWWMSATLQRRWLEESPDTGDLVKELRRKTHRIEAKNRHGQLWDDVTKPLTTAAFEKSSALVQTLSQRHRDLGCGKCGPTLVILNTVERAVEVWKALRRDRMIQRNGTDIRLVHSRFRTADRQSWRGEFLNPEACRRGIDRIIVSTQVVEAGVDISSFLLITEIAPWPALVQ